MFAPGPGTAEIAELDGHKVGILICYDVEFPEAVRALALGGADLVLVPTANMKPYDAVSLFVVPARAFESELYVAYANRCGREGELEYMGLSCVGDPNGGNLVLAGDGEELVFADLDPGEAEAGPRAQHPYARPPAGDLCAGWRSLSRSSGRSDHAVRACPGIRLWHAGRHEADAGSSSAMTTPESPGTARRASFHLSKPQCACDSRPVGTAATPSASTAERAIKRARKGFSTNRARKAAAAFRPTAMANTAYQP